MRHVRSDEFNSLFIIILIASFAGLVAFVVGSWYELPTKPKSDIEIRGVYIGMTEEEWRALKGSQFEVFDPLSLNAFPTNALFEDDKLINWTIKLDAKEANRIKTYFDSQYLLTCSFNMDEAGRSMNNYNYEWECGYTGDNSVLLITKHPDVLSVVLTKLHTQPTDG